MYLRRFLTVLCVACVCPHAAAAQTDPCLEPAQVFDAWLNCRIERVLAAKAGPGGAEKQAEAPSLSDDSPTLVDTTSAGDFVGLGLTLFRAEDGSDSDVSSGTTSVTATAYAFLAAAHGRDPLADRDFYYDHPNWRRVSFSLGRQPARDGGLGLNGEATLVAGKVLLLDLREIARAEPLADVQAAVTAAGLSYAGVRHAVTEALRAASAAPGADVAAFAAANLGTATFKTTLQGANAEVRDQIDRAIETRIEAEAALRDVIASTIAEIKRRPQISISAASALRGAGHPDEHRLEAIVDYGMAPRLELTVNAGVDLIDRKGLALAAPAARSSGRIAAALKLGLGAGDAFALRPPPAMSLSADLQWRASDVSYKTQLKLDLPVAGGLMLPVAFTWANRTELIEGKEVRGTIGFTIDTAKLVAAVR